LKRLVSLVVVLMLYARAAHAAAPTKTQCIEASDKADSLRQSGALRTARVSLLVCANPACPRIVRDDCNKGIAEVDASIPTVAFSARNGGEDVTAVTISMDGEMIAKEANGKAVMVDPGQHTFTFTLAGSPPQTQRLVLREGEKNRNVLIQFGDLPKDGSKDGPTGRLVVSSGAGAAISIDGKATTVGRFEGPVSIGSHEVKVSESGKVTATRMVEVKANATESINVTLEPEKASLFPWIIGGAAVVTAGLVVGGILLFGSKDKTNAPPQGSLGGIGLASFR
jgi:hypothetical protein